MRNVGLLCVRNEADVLSESLAEHCRFFDAIVAQDGSDDGGTELLRACPNIVKLFLDSEVIRPGQRFSDGHRNVALQWIMDEFGAKDVWVTLLHADEFFHDDPIRAAEEAHAAGASFVVWGEFRFFLHVSDRCKPWPAPACPVRERVRWYGGPFFEVRQFCLETHQVYIPGRDHATLPAGFQCRRWKAQIPRYRHYPYRSPKQMLRAYQDKCASRYWQPDHAWIGEAKSPKDLYLERLPEPRNSPLAAWQNTAKFDGSLPDPRIFLPKNWTG